MALAPAAAALAPPATLSVAAAPARVRFCGVPEHFNIPWTEALAAGAFAAAGVDASWAPVPGGTGAMVAALEAGEVDVAVALTEGIFAAAARGGGALRYAGGFVASRLRWMVATGAARGDLPALAAVAARGGAIRVSVSRLGSGSHLMACLLALREGWPVAALEFVEHRDFRTMRKGARGRRGVAVLREGRAPLTPSPPSPSQPSRTARPIFSCGSGL